MKMNTQKNDNSDKIRVVWFFHVFRIQGVTRESSLPENFLHQLTPFTDIYASTCCIFLEGGDL